MADRPKIDTDAIKASHPIQSTIENLTGERVTHHKIRCPFHADDSPSLHVYDDGGWKCYGCGLYGDVISFVGYFRYGTQYDPAIHFIDIVDSLGALDIKPLPPQPTKPKPPKPKLNISLESIMQWSDTMPAKRRAYWYSRGLTDQTISEFMLGFDGQRYTIPALYRLIPFGVKRRITPENFATELDLHERYVQSVRDAHPEWANEKDSKVYSMAVDELKALHPDWTDYQIRQAAPPEPVKYTGLYGSSVGIFNSDTLLDAHSVVICEGEIDAMLLHQSGIRAVSSTGGAGSWKPEWAKFFTHIERVFVLYDNDKPGREGAKKIQTSIRRAKVLTLPEGVKDVGELFQVTTSAADYVRWKIGT